LHFLLYKYLGWSDVMPEFAHLPLLLKPDGNGKLSKRDGDRLGFPVFPLQWTDPKSGEISSGYRESGYLPDAFINMLAFLGWNPGTEQELFTKDELINAFSIERVSKSGAKFDLEKAYWFNHQYMAQLSASQLAKLFIPILVEKDIEICTDYVEEVCELIKDRVILIPDLWKQSHFFFLDPESYDEKVVAKIWKPETPTLLREYAEILEAVVPFSSQNIHNRTTEFVQNKGIGMGQLMNPFRLTIVGTNAGPGMFDMAQVIGKEYIIPRILRAVETISL
jgi:glutamyl-tRNA synthetase